MRHVKSDDDYILCLNRGEEIIGIIRDFVRREKIPSGLISGIGAVMNTRLGFYHLSKKAYEERFFVEEAELVSLSGNASWLDEKPIIHCHITIGDTQFKAYCGHLFAAEVAVTAEIFINVKSTKVERRFKSEMGLNLFDLPIGAA